MALFAIEIADADVPRVTHACSKAGGFSEDSVENATQHLIDYICATVQNVEAQEAHDAAVATIPPPAPAPSIALPTP